MERRAILVTGVSSGIGRLLTQYLAEQGHLVYAAARMPEALSSWARMSNVRPLRLDLADSHSIAGAVEDVARSGTGLYAIVNNAGVATYGSVLESSEAEFDLVMGVNARGTYLVTRAFAPFVIAQKGRIVTIGSIAGILAEKNLSVYSMSKHAVEAFVDSLAQELMPQGVSVSIVEPGAFQTRLAENMNTRMGAKPGMPNLSTREEPHVVVLAIASALFDRAPRRRYLVVAKADEACRTLSKQIEQLVQLNQGHAFSLERDKIVALIDEALAALSG